MRVKPNPSWKKFSAHTHQNFSLAADPLDADDWLHDIKGKLNLCRCNDEEKTAYASYYLQGAAAAWWENYKAVLPQGVPITWNVFKEAFRNAHNPEGVMEIKRKEFRNLVQNNMPFMDFLNKFNYLSCYVHKEMTTEARKVTLCQERLNPELRNQQAAVHPNHVLGSPPALVHQHHHFQGHKCMPRVLSKSRFSHTTVWQSRPVLKTGLLTSIAANWDTTPTIAHSRRGWHKHFSPVLPSSHRVPWEGSEEAGLAPNPAKLQLAVISIM
ncbi:hypothetical protein E2562_035033 [Oryza meyeriana var. granulata]|uniref:Retrotransposon gag domain-containing protein n=1 Tax=Oryza meyeriana var. granulata TaxID=110450 RepID=A0A6G1FFK3_9ORYZ|nr:hypothetical protein E2562_035033 [Oryza meyeriana var. granulata]